MDEGAVATGARTRRRVRPGRVSHGTPPHAVVVRPSLPLHVMVSAVAISIPAASRNGNSVWSTALEHGATSRQVLAIFAYWSVVAVWAVTAGVRARTTLRAEPGLPVVLSVQGAFRRRTYDPARVRQVRLVTLASGSASRQVVVLLDAEEDVVATPTTHRGIWTRDDTRELLRSWGVAVTYEHRLSGPDEVEAAYPGSTAWTDRHPRAFVVATLAALAVIVPGGVWFFDLA